MSVRPDTIPLAIARDGGPSPFAPRRRRGLLLVVGGVAVGAPIFALLIVLSRIGVIAPRVSEHVEAGVTIRELRWSAIWGIPVVIPLFTTLIGTIQVLTGRSLKDLGNAYETLSGGRRLLVSLLVIALALAVLGCLVAIAFEIML